MGNCDCGGIRLIYACSGCADVGELADLAVRKIKRSEKIKMSCLSGIGAGLDWFIQSAKAACGNVTVDGCGVACAKKTLLNYGVTPVSVVLTDQGFVKGETAVSDRVVNEAVRKILTEAKI